MVLGRSFVKLSSRRHPDGFIYTTYHNSITSNLWAHQTLGSKKNLDAISGTGSRLFPVPTPDDAVINRVCWVLGRTRPLEKQANCKFILLFVISSSLFFRKEARFDLATSRGDHRMGKRIFVPDAKSTRRGNGPNWMLQCVSPIGCCKAIPIPSWRHNCRKSSAAESDEESAES